MDDRTLKQDVTDALDFDPSIQAQNIGIAVDAGVITISGHVASYAEKTVAERAVQRVRGVKGIAEQIQVRYPFEKQTADHQIAHRALSIISWDTQIPEGAVQVKVEHGVLTLSGQVDWFYQNVAADAAVRRLSGVTAVANLIKIAPHANNPNVKAKILEALKREALLDSEAIHVIVVDDKVRLEGEVKAWHQRSVAETAAWPTPGVMEVLLILVRKPRLLWRSCTVEASAARLSSLRIVYGRRHRRRGSETLRPSLKRCYRRRDRPPRCPHPASSRQGRAVDVQMSCSRLAEGAIGNERCTIG